MAKVPDEALGIKDTPDDNFPSNANKEKRIGQIKQEREEKPEKQKTVVKGRVLKRKKSPGKKISEFLFADDVKNVFQYIFLDVLIPVVKSTILDIVSISADRMLFGDDGDSVRRRSHKRYLGGSSINYGNYSKGDPENRYFREHRTSSKATGTSLRARASFHDIVIQDRNDIEEVLTKLEELIDVYGQASIADFYDLVGVETSFVDYKHGWDNLARATIKRVRDGYIIDFPRPEQL